MWSAPDDKSFAPGLGHFSVWTARQPQCANEAFNYVNGDVFVWKFLWPQLAKYFGAEVSAWIPTQGLIGMTYLERRLHQTSRAELVQIIWQSGRRIKRRCGNESCPNIVVISMPSAGALGIILIGPWVEHGIPCHLCIKQGHMVGLELMILRKRISRPFGPLKMLGYCHRSWNESCFDRIEEPRTNFPFES